MVKVMKTYNKFYLSSKDEGMEREVIEIIKHITLRWFGHIERIPEILK